MSSLIAICFNQLIAWQAGRRLSSRAPAVKL